MPKSTKSNLTMCSHYARPYLKTYCSKWGVEFLSNSLGFPWGATPAAPFVTSIFAKRCFIWKLIKRQQFEMAGALGHASRYQDDVCILNNPHASIHFNPDYPDIYERELTYLYVKKHKNMIILSTNDSVHTRTYWNSWML
jgi:hypothetical protein